MKKIIGLVLILAMIPITAFAGVETYKLVKSEAFIMVGGSKVDTGDKPVMNYNGSTYLPLRKVAEAIGAKIDYEPNHNKITIDNGLDIEKLKESCVFIDTVDSTGSGFVYDYGKVLTCYHVVDNSNKNTAEFTNGSKEALTKVKDFKDIDVSILSINSTVKPVKIGDSDEVKAGDKVWLISSPKGKKNIVTSGEVIEVTSYNRITYIHSSAECHEGSSGGALFNSKGELIGIEDKDSTLQDGSGYAIPINDIRKALSK